ncbi:arginase-1-like [Paramacrobiotus metropolitanus]|uniref:arginase-1-like n=1 Tax=Paramacrobiotus metropolitanus TaxID=2943436 RepID=UPI0024457848|nr:arginase-1-like [Paramacrobiotus metropolitanus]XP_055348817.1 arginase-1-like [Paramacrobiotus metropolitanus]
MAAVDTRLGFIEAPWPSWNTPCLSRNPEHTGKLPAWINKIISAWRSKGDKTEQLQPAPKDPAQHEALLRRGSVLSMLSTKSGAEINNYTAKYFGNAADAVTSDRINRNADDITQNIQIAGTLSKQVQLLVRNTIQTGCTPIVFATGRIPALGSIAGHGMAASDMGILDVGDASSVCLVYLDLFANMDSDILDYTQYSTRCPAAFLLKESFGNIPKKFPGFEWLRPWLGFRRVAVIGLQKPSESEIAFLESKKIHYCTCDDLASRGAVDTIKTALNAINPRNDLPIHLSINAFAVDFALEARVWPEGHRKILAVEALDIVKIIVKTGMLGALDILEVEQLPIEDQENAASVFNEILQRVAVQTRIPYPPRLPAPEALSADF